jgi:DNA invertase Pin-like site-specific DNA recombinase
MILKMLDCVIDFKRCVAAKRISAGLARARRRGVKLGRPQTVSVRREDVKAFRARGMTGRRIATELGIPSSTVFKLIGQLKG